MRSLSKRMALIKSVAKYKVKNGLKVRDTKREINVIKVMVLFGNKLGLRSSFVKIIGKELLSESKRVQKRIKEK